MSNETPNSVTSVNTVLPGQSNGQILTWNSSLRQWEPSTGGGSGVDYAAQQIFTNTTPSASYLTGAMKLAGGLGVTGAIYSGASINAYGILSGTTLICNTAILNGTATASDITASGVLKTNANTPSTSITTGALQVTGGAGITGAVNIGGNISIIGTLNAGASTMASAIVTGSLTASSLTLGSNIITAIKSGVVKVYNSNYIPGSISSSIEFYGDSFVFGYALSDPTKRWTTLLSSKLSKTEINYGVSELQWEDLIRTPRNSPFNYHVNGNTAVVALGINDLHNQPVSQGYIKILDMMDVYILYMCLNSSKGVTPILPSNNIFDGANSNVFTYSNGTFDTIPQVAIGKRVSTSIGLVASLLSNTNIIKGRYIILAMAFPNGVNSSIWGVKVDGNFVAYDQGATSATSYSVNTTMNISGDGVTSTTSSLFFYDTESAVNTYHTVEFLAGPGITLLYAGAINGDGNDASNSVFVVAPTYNIINTSLPNITAFRTAMQEKCDVWRVRYKLPIYYVATHLPCIYGSLLKDLLHPSTSGHRAIASCVEDVMQNGQFQS